MNAYLAEIKLIIGALLIVVSFAFGWEVKGWKVGNDTKDVATQQIKDMNGKIDQFNKDQQTTIQQGIVLGSKLDALDSHQLAVEREIHNASLTKPVAAGCNNPFTLDLVRLLNGDTSTGTDPGSAAVGGLGPVPQVGSGQVQPSDSNGIRH